MKTTHLLVLLLTLAAAPLSAGGALLPPAPRTHCETDPADLSTHLYGPGTGFLYGPAVDGAAEDCDGDGAYDPLVDWDRHLEYAPGGAWLVVAGMGTLCTGLPGDHADRPTITIHDEVLGDQAVFLVEAPRGIYDPEEDVCVQYAIQGPTITCTGSCQVPFAAEVGQYHVYVLRGTTGRIVAS